MSQTYVDLGRELVEFDEEKEPEDFWEALGGKEEYSRVKNTGLVSFEPRLFHCSTDQGWFTAQEVHNFTQEDLVNTDVMFLDTYDDVYVWIGKHSNKYEHKAILDFAAEYISKTTDGRD